MQWTNQCLQAIFYSMMMSACTIIPKDPVVVNYEMLPGYHFYSPCGQARICGDLPATNTAEQSGYYLVYVLNDSLDISNCVSSTQTLTARDTLPMHFGRDFLMTMAVHDGGKDWFFDLQQMEIVDSILHVHLKVHHRKDAAVLKPGYNLSDNYVWKINGQGTKLIKLYISSSNYAYIPGPQWSDAPVSWEHAHWGESPPH